MLIIKLQQCLYAFVHLSKTHLKFKSREISFDQNIHFSCQIVLKFCTEHGSYTAVLCAKFQKTIWQLSKIYGHTRLREIWL